jgi:signal transduction histidine kinase/DNA-binding response OmpR family regulator
MEAMKREPLASLENGGGMFGFNLKENGAWRGLRGLSLFVAVCLFCCAQDAMASFRTIPGITHEEIEAVEKVLAGRTSFTYGMLESSECFFQEDGSVDGYAALMGQWLSELFGIPFEVRIYSWKDLSEGLRNGSVDFTTDFTPMGVRSRGLFMTRPFMERSIKTVTSAASIAPEEIARYRPVRVAFLRNSTAKVMVLPRLNKEYNGNLTVIDADSVNEVTKLFHRQEIDLFIADSAWVERFHGYPDLTVGLFQPLLHKRLSLSTSNPELAPIVTAISRSFSNDTLNRLYDLHQEGKRRFYRKIFIGMLNEAERNYYEEHIRTKVPIPVGASPTNYPIEFFNDDEGQWDGIAFDILDEIRDITGLSFRPMRVGEDNWPLLMRMLKRGDPDVPMVMDMAFNESRRRDFLLAEKPYLKDYYALISTDNLKNLRHNQVLFHRVGMLQDTAYADVFHQWFPSHENTMAFRSQAEEVRALENGDIDLLMFSQFHFSYITNYLKQTKFKINLVFEDPMYTGFGFNKEQNELRGIISKAQSLIDTQAIVRRWEYSVFDFRSEAARTRSILLVTTCIFMLLVILLLVQLLLQRRHESQRLKSLVIERTHELAEQIKATENASASKSRFLANISHEMRTPLNAIIGLSGLVLDTGKLPEEASHDIGKIRYAGDTLLAIVNDLLDISKIEAGKIELSPEKYEVASLINDTIDINIVRRGDKPISFVLNMDETLPGFLFGDALRVRQIFNNLLSNAFKYTERGLVEWAIGWQRDKDGVCLFSTVKDTGIGIRTEDIERVFSEYNQVDDSSTRYIEGTGLGLPIARRLVELMGGTLTLESEYGKGSIFSMRIRQGFVTDIPIGADVVEHLKNFQYKDQKRQQNARIVCHDLSDCSILLVDDVETNMDVAKGMLKPYGVRVDCVSSGQQAIDAIRYREFRYDAIFMDHMMPGMDGVEAMNRIRAIGTEYARHVPIIVLTANVISGNEKMFLEKGFHGFLAKPIDINRLDVVLKQWVRKATKKNAPENQAPPSANGAASGSGWQISGIDLDKAKRRFGGDESILVDVLRSYARHTPALLQQAAEVTRAGLADYAIVVHGIKGSSYGIGADTLGDKAKELEFAAKAGDFSFVTEHNADFIESARQLIAELNEKLTNTGADDKPEKDAPDPKVLERLRKACANYDMDGMDAALAELESFRYASGQELVSWLREEVDGMELQRIEKRLSDLDAEAWTATGESS